MQTTESSILSHAIDCIKTEAQTLLDLIPQLDGEFERAVKLILGCHGKVIVTGVGKSGHVGAKIAATLSSTGTPSFFVNPLDVFHGDLGVMTKDDIVLAISNSGQTDELLRFVPLMLHMNIPIIGMSGNSDSLLAKYSTIHISTHVAKEACPLNLAPTASTTAEMAMGDALAIALMEERGFKSTDFAQFHPGGELGKRLLTTVADVMRRDDLPTVAPCMPLADALIEISRGKMGMAVAMTGQSVAGIITDGDIRRAMERWKQEFFSHTVGEIMTTNPKCVSPDINVSEAGSMMNKYKTNTMPVVDSERHLLGILDHYNCMI